MITYTVLTDSNWKGWNGNSTIYPTKYTQSVDLPSEPTTAVWVGSSNDSYSNNYGTFTDENGVSLAIADSTGFVPSYINTGGSNQQFEAQVWLGAIGGSQNYLYNDNLGDDFSIGPDAIQVGASGPALPSGSSVQISYTDNTGVNVTTPSGSSDQGTTIAEGILQGALFTAAVFMPLELGIPLVADGLANYYGNFGAFSSGSVPSCSDHFTPGSPSLCQWAEVTGGQQGTGCSGGCGSNAFGQGTSVEIQIPANDLGSVTGGKLYFSAMSELTYIAVLCTDQNGNPSCITDTNYQQGVATSTSNEPYYYLEPAASLGGKVYAYYNSACAPNCPLVPGAVVTVANSQVNLPNVVTDYVETANSGAGWHFFAEPSTSGLTQSWGASWSDALGSTGNVSVLIPPAALAEGADTETMNAVLDGGQVTGTVTNVAGSVVPYATVKLCNNNGCISNIASVGGTFAMAFPIAGTTSNPYSLTISAPGQVTTSYTGLTLAVGGSTQKNLQFRQGVSFTETGLPGGQSWSVTLGGTKITGTGTTLSWAVSSGTYSYTIPQAGPSPPLGQTYCEYNPSPASGSVTFSGTNVAVSVTFVCELFSPITFTATGLVTGPLGGHGTMTVILGGKTYGPIGPGSSLVISEPNGTYSFAVPTSNSSNNPHGPTTTYYPLPASGAVAITGNPVTVSVQFFTSPAYPVNFAETGLPSGTEWNATFNAITTASQTGTIVAGGPNGTYSYSIPKDTISRTPPQMSPTYFPYPRSGSISIGGSAATIPVTFLTVFPYPINFTENGLPIGVLWNVSIGATTAASTGSAITVVEGNGSYTYSIPSIRVNNTIGSGYTIYSAGNPAMLLVSGRTVTVQVQFRGHFYPVPFLTGENVGVASSNHMAPNHPTGAALGALALPLVALRARRSSRLMGHATTRTPKQSEARIPD